MLRKSLELSSSFFVVVLLALNLSSCKHTAMIDSSILVKAKKISSFWDSQQKGANFFNEQESSSRLDAAARSGLHFVRLTPSKWKSTRANSKRGDFLLGDRNHYTGLVKQDSLQLRAVLDQAHQAGLRVVLTFLDIPGHYWLQHNNRKQDRRLWEDRKHWSSAIQFFVDIAKEFKGHPALVGYDLLNEPSPEKTGIKLEDWLSGSYEIWNAKIAKGPQDINEFYLEAVRAIRMVDATIPIIIEAGYYATPWAINGLKPIDDENVLYSVHMYEPFSFTFSHKQEDVSYSYPGVVPYGECESTQKSQLWDKSALREFPKQIRSWQEKFRIPNNRILIGEFGVNRMAKGAPQYFSDLIEIFDDYKWHWAFYSFREDSWSLMDYELGQKKPPWSYWQAIEKKQVPTYPQGENPFL